jgi:hypothetical protein
VSKDEQALIRPITLEDEDFIKNIKDSSTVPLNAVFEVNPQTITQQDEEAEWDDILTPSQA